MKVFLLLLSSFILLLSCRKDYTPTDLTVEDSNITDSTVTDVSIDNKVLLLKVDNLTYAFEGGYELPFYDTSSFHISAVYNSPGDFGDITLYYEEFNALLFSGTIIWMGTGEQTYPTAFMPETIFDTISQSVPMPDYVYFEDVQYSTYQNSADNGKYDQIWTSISNLELVSDYRLSNPNGKIYSYLYTPSVGMGNPAEWDWLIFMKN